LEIDKLVNDALTVIQKNPMRVIVSALTLWIEENMKKASHGKSHVDAASVRGGQTVSKKKNIAFLVISNMTNDIQSDKLHHR